MTKHRKSKPTNAKRRRRQKLKRQFARAREDAQLIDFIPTTPAEAVQSEIVDPATQETQQFYSLDRAAINCGWPVPGAEKPKVIQRLFDQLQGPGVSPWVVVINARALIKAEKLGQMEREAARQHGNDLTQQQVLDMPPNLRDALFVADAQH
jgi:hypothetical protein